MITQEQVQSIFAPIFDSALKHSGIQADAYIQKAKAILAENMKEPEQKGGEEDDNK